MELSIQIPDYDEREGFKYYWKDGFEIDVNMLLDGAVRIRANKAGLESLANHLLNLAQDAIPAGHHLHLDETNALEQGSLGLIIEKTA